MVKRLHIDFESVRVCYLTYLGNELALKQMGTIFLVHMAKSVHMYVSNAHVRMSI